MRLGIIVVAAVLGVAALGMADLPRYPCVPEPAGPLPLDAVAVVDLIAGPLLANGISILFLSSLLVVGAPWLIAGLAVAALHWPARFRTR
jgi:hypothetical protein